MSLEQSAEALQSKEGVVPDNEFAAYLDANLRYPQHFFLIKTVLAAEIALNPQLNVKANLFAKLSAEQLLTARRAMDRVHHAYNIRPTPADTPETRKKPQVDAPLPQRPVVTDQQLQRLWVNVQTQAYDFIGHVLGAKDSEGKSLEIGPTDSKPVIKKITDVLEKRLTDSEARTRMQNFFTAVREIVKEPEMTEIGKQIRELSRKINEVHVNKNEGERWRLYNIRREITENFCNFLFKEFEEKTGASMSPEIQQYCKISLRDG